MTTTVMHPVSERIDGLPWNNILETLNMQGFATIGQILTPANCQQLIALYDDAAQFRSHVIMQRHGFGRGEYQYFAYPLPPIVETLRRSVYPHLVPLANGWAMAMKQDTLFPDTLSDFLAGCRADGQTRPTPLLLKYKPEDFNCLHQDLYGAKIFPFQLAVMLNAPGADFSGGEFVLTEQKPRAQSKAEIVPLRRGEAVIFAVNHRPGQGKRGFYRVTLKHGVSRVRSGERHCLGVIFHDAK